MEFKLRSAYQPRGDQPAAIDQLVRGSSGRVSQRARQKKREEAGVTDVYITHTKTKKSTIGTITC